MKALACLQSPSVRRIDNIISQYCLKNLALHESEKVNASSRSLQPCVLVCLVGLPCWQFITVYPSKGWYAMKGSNLIPFLAA